MSDITNNNYQEEESSLDLTTILNILIGKWYWFAASAALFLLLGCIYLYRAPKVFQKNATVLIKEEKNGMGSGVASQAATFADIAGVAGLSASNTENEMLILQSRSLMQQVVYRLGLHITYYERHLLRSLELYENTPLRIVEKEPGTLIPSYLQLTPLSESKFRIEMEAYDEATQAMRDTTFTGEFNKLLALPFGLATIQSYPDRLQYHIGRTLRIYIQNPKRVTSAYLQSLSVTRMNKTASMLSLGIKCSRPGKGEDILNTLLDQYNRDAIEDKNHVLDNTNAFIAERLITIRKELGDVDSRIEGYKRATLSTDMQTESQIYLQSASTLEEKIYANRIQSSLIDILADFMKNPLHQNDLLPYNIGLENQSLNTQIQVYNDNMIRLNRMLASSSDRNPVVEDLRASLEAARASIVKTVGEMQRSLRLQESQLASRNRKATGRIESVSTNERNVQSITRDQKIKAELYLYLLNKSEENAIVRSTTEPNARIIDRAYGLDIPVAPRKLVILLACLLIGLGIPGAYFLVKDMIYTKVRGRSDVAKTVHAPILGEIPNRTDMHTSDAMVVHAGSGSQLSESFRILRTNLSFLNTEGVNQVFALTSSIPGEGKTFVTMNLAMTMALTGKRVCLVDLDLRRASLSKALQIKGHKGVTEYLAGKADDLSSLVRTTAYSDALFAMASGTVPPNPAELLMNSRFDQLIAYLRTQFDYIFLDNPPVHVVADASIANRCADLTLYVVRAGVLDRRELEAVETLYQDHTLKNMSVLVNGVDYEQLYYSIGYKGYGKRYGYGKYGYSYAKKYGSGYYKD